MSISKTKSLSSKYKGRATVTKWLAKTEILNQSIETHWNQEVFPLRENWQRAIDKSDVIHQWDSERDIIGKRLNRQAIQIGIRGKVIRAKASSF